ncbi:TonB-dependent receptor plug domain-containing protein, partial [Sulfuricurvum sp. UBA5598]
MLRPLILYTCTFSLICAQEILQLDKIEVEDHYSVIEERKENSIAKRIIKGEELTQYGDMNALEVLKRTPGVTIPEGKGKKGSPGKGYTKVLVDGEEVSATSKRRGSPLEQISPDMIERIEVMTNGSAEYTAEAMGGIVNIVLKKPASEGKTIAKVTGGIYNEQPMASVFAQREGKNGDLSYLFNATYADNTHKDDSST